MPIRKPKNKNASFLWGCKATGTLSLLVRMPKNLAALEDRQKSPAKLDRHHPIIQSTNCASGCLVNWLKFYVHAKPACECL